MLDKGYNFQVSTLGVKADILKIKYILAGRVMAHHFRDGEFHRNLKNLGFKKFILTDGYDETYTWKE